MKLSLLVLAILVPTTFAQQFTPSSTTVPPTFKGNDAKGIAKGLLLSPLKKRKDEFETTAAYEKRRNDLAGTTLTDGTNAASQLIFRLQDFGSGLDQSGASYDADTEILTFRLRVSEFSDYTNTVRGPWPSVLLAPSDFEDLGTYIGENAYGTKREITKSVFTKYRLVINNEQQFPKLQRGPNGYNSFAVVLKLSPELARVAKENFAVLYFAKLSSPYLGLDFLDKKPQIDSPSEIKSTTYCIYADVSEIWFYNKQTGEVLSKIKADPQLKTSESPQPKILQ